MRPKDGASVGTLAAVGAVLVQAVGGVMVGHAAPIATALCGGKEGVVPGMPPEVALPGPDAAPLSSDSRWPSS